MTEEIGRVWVNGAHVPPYFLHLYNKNHLVAASTAPEIQASVQLYEGFQCMNQVP